MSFASPRKRSPSVQSTSRRPRTPTREEIESTRGQRYGYGSVPFSEPRNRRKTSVRGHFHPTKKTPKDKLTPFQSPFDNRTHDAIKTKCLNKSHHVFPRRKSTSPNRSRASSLEPNGRRRRTSLQPSHHQQQYASPYPGDDDQGVRRHRSAGYWDQGVEEGTPHVPSYGNPARVSPVPSNVSPQVIESVQAQIPVLIRELQSLNACLHGGTSPPSEGTAQTQLLLALIAGLGVQQQQQQQQQRQQQQRTPSPQRQPSYRPPQPRLVIPTSPDRPRAVSPGPSFTESVSIRDTDSEADPTELEAAALAEALSDDERAAAAYVSALEEADAHNKSFPYSVASRAHSAQSSAAIINGGDTRVPAYARPTYSFASKTKEGASVTGTASPTSGGKDKSRRKGPSKARIVRRRRQVQEQGHVARGRDNSTLVGEDTTTAPATVQQQPRPRSKSPKRRSPGFDFDTERDDEHDFDAPSRKRFHHSEHATSTHDSDRPQSVRVGRSTQPPASAAAKSRDRRRSPKRPHPDSTPRGWASHATRDDDDDDDDEDDDDESDNDNSDDGVGGDVPRHRHKRRKSFDDSHADPIQVVSASPPTASQSRVQVPQVSSPIETVFVPPKRGPDGSLQGDWGYKIPVSVGNSTAQGLNSVSAVTKKDPQERLDSASVTAPDTQVASPKAAQPPAQVPTDSSLAGPSATPPTVQVSGGPVAPKRTPPLPSPSSTSPNAQGQGKRISPFGRTRKKQQPAVTVRSPPTPQTGDDDAIPPQVMLPTSRRPGKAPISPVNTALASAPTQPAAPTATTTRRQDIEITNAPESIVFEEVPMQESSKETPIAVSVNALTFATGPQVKHEGHHHHHHHHQHQPRDRGEPVRGSTGSPVELPAINPNSPAEWAKLTYIADKHTVHVAAPEVDIREAGAVDLEFSAVSLTQESSAPIQVEMNTKTYAANVSIPKPMGQPWLWKRPLHDPSEVDASLDSVSTPSDTEEEFDVDDDDDDDDIVVDNRGNAASPVRPEVQDVAAAYISALNGNNNDDATSDGGSSVMESLSASDDLDDSEDEAPQDHHHHHHHHHHHQQHQHRQLPQSRQHQRTIRPVPGRSHVHSHGKYGARSTQAAEASASPSTRAVQDILLSYREFSKELARLEAQHSADGALLEQFVSQMNLK